MQAFWNWLKSLFAPKVISNPEPIKQEPGVSIYERIYKTALAELGTKEISGSKDTPRIVEYHSVTSLKATDDETPWCSSFVCWVLKKAGFKHTKSAAAKSWDTYGVKLSKPVRGCIVCVEHIDSSGKKTGRRHVALYSRDSSDPGFEYHLGGNQGNEVTLKKVDKREVNSYRGVAQ